MIEYLIQTFLKSSDNGLESNTLLRVTLFICFVIVLVVAYLFFWIPSANKVQKEVKS